MNVNFIRTGVLISMNLDPEGVIAAAAGSILTTAYTHAHTHTHTHSHKYIRTHTYI